MAANLFLTSIALLKTTLLHLNKKRFLNLVLYTRRNFWHSNYDDNEKVFMNETRRYFTFIITVTYCIMVYVPCSYFIIPMFENSGRNYSDRALPLRMWTDLPLYETPYFEICFALQALCVFHIGICYVCLDNYFLLINTHTACQFRMLQDKLLNLLDPNSEMIDSPDYADQCYQNLRRYIRKHQALINYCNRLEIIFSFNIFCYVLVFSVLTCLSMYQALLGEISTIRRVSFLIYVAGSVFQLIMLTNSCGSLITESMNVGAVAYAISWAALSMNKSGRMVRRDVQMIITRSQKPCQLTAGGFFPVSLQTSTKLISSAVSYFTLLRESSSNVQDT
ncbi:odorant receptor 13a-like [Halictus rubicundus]|uniref:odorant receptor 13a-like n=1 Tax=Halictus rubicundus TaxID=77578 RepID=UPI00403682ED